MSKKQIEKNFELSEKLAVFLGKNPKKMKTIPKDSSFVVFSATDKLLNKINEKLINSLEKQGRTVIKAQETKKSESPWEFTPSCL